MRTVTLIPGDGIGPEITKSVVKILEKAGAEIEWDIQSAGADVIEKEGTPLPERVIESIKKNKVALKAPVTTPIGKGFRSVNVSLRKSLDLYANLRPSEVVNLEEDKLTSLNINLDDLDYEITLTYDSKLKGTYNEEEVDVSTLMDKLEGLEASSFDLEDKEATKLQVSIQINLDNENYSSLNIDIYQIDSAESLIKLNGSNYCIVERSDVIDLIEAINEIVL